ncbi:MAG: penicillin-binding protein 2 [Eubacteriales bacterium]|nr:penicillin-binding protein 2 [Eubacteriales bacterium]
MKELRFRVRIISILLLFLLVVLALYASYSVKIYGTRWFGNGRNVRVLADKDKVLPGKIYDVNGKLLRYTDGNGERKSTGSILEQSALVHVLGDSQNQVSNGVEKFQARYLYGYDAGFGDLLYSFVRGQKRVGDNITLTIDSALQTKIVEQFQNHANLRGKNGAAVVMNYKTGEVLALVSVPVFDPHHIPESAFTDERNPFFNRATQSVLPPGSTFKMLTMAAALQDNPKLWEEDFICNGAFLADQLTIKDYGGAVHDTISLQRAFEVSCNNVFAQISVNLGTQKMKNYAEQFGFNDNFLFGDIVVENSSFPLAENTFQLATSGIGQSKLLSTPMHMCMVAAGIANDGVMMEPLLLKKVQSNNGTVRFTMEPTVYRSAVPPDVARKLQTAMLGVVSRGTGTRAAISGYKVAGKTGSAESVENGKPVTHAWFTGFITNPNKPYAVCVFVENGGTGGRVAAPLAHTIFQELSRSHYE